MKWTIAPKAIVQCASISIFCMSMHVNPAQAQEDALWYAMTGFQQHTIEEPFGPAPLSKYAEVWILPGEAESSADVRARSISALESGHHHYTLRFGEEVFLHPEGDYYDAAPPSGDRGMWYLMNLYDRVVLHQHIAFHRNILEIPGIKELESGVYRWYYDSDDDHTRAHGLLFVR